MSEGLISLSPPLMIASHRLILRWIVKENIAVLIKRILGRKALSFWKFWHIFKLLRLRLVSFGFVIPAEAGIQGYRFLVSGFPFSREWQPECCNPSIGQIPNLDKIEMKTNIFLPKKESLVQFKEVRNLSAPAITVNRSILIWTKNGLTKKIPNG